MKKTFMILFALLTLLALTMTGCGKRSSGIYSSEEMTQIHDVSGSVENMSRVYDNVVNKSLPSTINSRLAKDPGYGEYLSTMTIDPSKPMIALTFDDGPNDSSTVQILDTLEKYNARATFFVVGSNAKEHGDILKKPKNAILKQYQKLLALDGVDLEFEDEAIEAIADKALQKKTGARALRSIIEEFMLDVMYEIPKDDNIGTVTITKDYVEKKGGPLIQMRGTPELADSQHV